VLTVPQAAHGMRKGHIVLFCNDDIDRKTRSFFSVAGQFANEQTIRQLIALSGQERISLVIENDHRTVLAHFASNEETIHTIATHIRSLVNSATRLDALQQLSGLTRITVPPDEAHDYDEVVFNFARLAGLEPFFLCGSLGDLQRSAIDDVISMSEIEDYRRTHHVSFISETNLPTTFATFRLRHYQEIATSQPYLALYLGDLSQGEQPPLVRLHSACATGDILGSQRCDCQAQLHAALREIAREGRGLLLYLPQEGRGIGLTAKLQAYLLQDQGLDTIAANEQLGYPVDARDYASAAEILHNFALKRIRLLTNNPQKIHEISASGIAVERVPLEIAPTDSSEFYLRTKYERLGHLFNAFPTPGE
jgi:3,4-dihydroxy 2-butanone 4-phosphate synthase/GTP cyclohydrolase II